MILTRAPATSLLARGLSSLFILLLIVTLVAGCAQRNRIVDQTTDDADTPLGLDYRDFEQAALDAVNSMLGSSIINKPREEPYVLAISRVTNDTMQRIDTSQLIKKIRIALLQSGKVVTTSAVSGDGSQDVLIDQVRANRDSEEFRQDTQVERGQLANPDLSLSGKIFQRNLRQDKNTQQVEYYFQLTLTDLRNGLAVWEGETPIIKRGSNDSVAW
ncbi:penicillin-binding protein activator LpoB [Hydrocarboniclastica marina]|uniref:Penicillin-binding protein activator LpoB n=1 Tax=Hydrocarboniclastica marina TaxID=2259620 RepID=A0A4P7XL45_9ALTE|nr:penicillin-binding protein activator LpoB [Hydrocarboniclastica marina]MAM00381.1 penicillin-binding protein activator LpoB [Alteromonadaceae bacterium]QCF27645.1 penicillin-binding protein activator LpoB [Hydrocarboniclastica marina]